MSAVNELPMTYRVVFHLRDVEGLTNQEVAKVLGLSLTNVKARIRRARLFLRDKLSDYLSTNGENKVV
jgi:RNA polymerase sigma-70 factor (ECF subfamily)